MGTNFFKTGGFGSINAGKFGNLVAPIAKYTQYVSPGAHMALEQANKYNVSKVMPVSTGYFAGKAPTLGDALAGYKPPAGYTPPAPTAPKTYPLAYGKF